MKNEIKLTFKGQDIYATEKDVIELIKTCESALAAKFTTKKGDVQFKNTAPVNDEIEC
ncbi:hypothetical protein [Yersinia bercovieri]|uniref:hypothetical protein n=1 Tax=Yersinia bercovieri TaxID=634 RepID=UPI0025AB30CF|nr:hypothetical protein [Yersinia bercovieri]MDN0101532.1 hypothetical protein [Yersinia bercovieri]HDL7423429.1 hypothetical protein [Yersinia enterocolitica]